MVVDHNKLHYLMAAFQIIYELQYGPDVRNSDLKCVPLIHTNATVSTEHVHNAINLYARIRYATVPIIISVNASRTWNSEYYVQGRRQQNLSGQAIL